MGFRFSPGQCCVTCDIRSDTFLGSSLSDLWTPKSGNWLVQNGQLVTASSNARIDLNWTPPPNLDRYKVELTLGSLGNAGNTLCLWFNGGAQHIEIEALATDGPYSYRMYDGARLISAAQNAFGLGVSNDGLSSVWNANVPLVAIDKMHGLAVARNFCYGMVSNDFPSAYLIGDYQERGGWHESCLPVNITSDALWITTGNLSSPILINDFSISHVASPGLDNTFSTKPWGPFGQLGGPYARWCDFITVDPTYLWPHHGFKEPAFTVQSGTWTEVPTQYFGSARCIGPGKLKCNVQSPVAFSDRTAQISLTMAYGSSAKVYIGDQAEVKFDYYSGQNGRILTTELRVAGSQVGATKSHPVDGGPGDITMYLPIRLIGGTLWSKYYSEHLLPYDPTRVSPGFGWDDPNNSRALTFHKDVQGTASSFTPCGPNESGYFGSSTETTYSPQTDEYAFECLSGTLTVYEIVLMALVPELDTWTYWGKI